MGRGRMGTVTEFGSATLQPAQDDRKTVMVRSEGDAAILRQAQDDRKTVMVRSEGDAAISLQIKGYRLLRCARNDISTSLSNV